MMVLVIQQSCSTTKRLPEGAYLLNANKITIVGYKKIEERQKLKEEVKKIAIQKPNKRAFGLLPIKLWLYSAANKPKENKFNWWIKNKVGEAPVILDTTLATKSDKALANYMQNTGFFNAKVTHEVQYKKRKAIVAYTITPGEAWKISSVMYPRPTYKTDSIVWQTHAKSVLKTGLRFDVSKLKAERERIESELQNSGFYFFTKDYVTFDLDTAATNHEVKINVIISQQNDSTQHLQYWMNNIYSITDFGMGDATNKNIKRDTLKKNEFYYIRKKDIVRPKVIRDGIFFEKNQLFQKENYLRTLSRLSNYGVYKFVSVEFEPKDTSAQILDAILRLTPAKRQSLGLDGQLNYNTEGFFWSIWWCQLS
jgi:outer membrane protein insertion porin family